MTAKYTRDDFSFQYPENWAIEEDPSTGVPRTISVTSEEGAFWSASLYLTDQPLRNLQDQYVDALEAEYEGLEIDDVEFQLADEKILATDFQFYCLDFLVHSRLIATQIGQFNVLIAWQAEDRDFDKLETVFMAITYSAIHQIDNASA